LGSVQALRPILSTSPEFKRIGSGEGGLRSGCLIIFWSVFARLSRQAKKRPIPLPADFASWLMARPRAVVRLSGRWPQRPIAGYRDQIINTGQCSTECYDITFLGAGTSPAPRNTSVGHLRSECMISTLGRVEADPENWTERSPRDPSFERSIAGGETWRIHARNMAGVQGESGAGCCPGGRHGSRIVEPVRPACQPDSCTGEDAAGWERSLFSSGHAAGSDDAMARQHLGAELQNAWKTQTLSRRDLSAAGARV